LQILIYSRNPSENSPRRNPTDGDKQSLSTASYPIPQLNAGFELLQPLQAFRTREGKGKQRKKGESNITTNKAKGKIKEKKGQPSKANDKVPNPVKEVEQLAYLSHKENAQLAELRQELEQPPKHES
jgi:hypothetical protein